jgi:hypothetical protein
VFLCSRRHSALLHFFLDDDDDDESSDEEESDDDASAASSCQSAAEDDEEPVPTQMMDCFTEFKYWYKRHWTFYRNKLLTAYVRVAYVLSPHPKVHADAKANIEVEDRLACESLLVKLFLPGFVEDNEVWERRKAAIVDKFLSELQDFQNKSGYFKTMSIWIAAEDPNLPSHRWHQRYSLLFTDYLGKLGCIVCSKMTGIGEAERMWKENKKTRGGQRCRLSTDKTKKQATISAAHSMNKSKARNASAKRRGKLMDDEDFKAMKMGK